VPLFNAVIACERLFVNKEYVALIIATVALQFTFQFFYRVLSWDRSEKAYGLFTMIILTIVTGFINLVLLCSHI